MRAPRGVVGAPMMITMHQFLAALGIAALLLGNLIVWP